MGSVTSRITSLGRDNREDQTNNVWKDSVKKGTSLRGAEGGSRERPEQGATTRTLQADSAGGRGDTRMRY